MGKVKGIIYSNEKSTGKIMYITSLFFSIPTITIAFFIDFHDGVWGNIFFALPFLAITLLLLVIGRFQQNKYDRLGPTPLKLTPSVCSVGGIANGSIVISKPIFNKVKNLTLSYFEHEKSNSDRASSKKCLWQESISPTITHIDNETILAFNIQIPEGKNATGGDFSLSSRYSWEMSFEYVEFMDNIKRTWKIPVSYATKEQ